MRNSYHQRIFQRYASHTNRNIDFDVRIELQNGLLLKATEQRTASKVGLLIDTGMTVPRESFYPVFAYFPDINILVYDKRGHADSDGSVNTNECIGDNLSISYQWKKALNLTDVIGMGHSYGGLIMACAALRDKEVYSAIIAAGAPVELNKVVGRMPKHLTRTFIFFYNLYRLIHKYSWDEIVRYHQSYIPWLFAKYPTAVAMRITSGEKFNNTFKSMVNLIEILPQLATKIYLYYGGSDSRLGINGKFTGTYQSMKNLCLELGILMKLMPGLSHRFNLHPEGEFAFSYNNSLILKEIERILKIYR